MGHGYWCGDRSGEYKGEITNLSIDRTGKIEFDYAYTKGAIGGGSFHGNVVGDRLIGSWNETCDGKPRAGIANMKRARPVELEQRFAGGYWLQPAPSDNDEGADWAIEFNL